jgi:hypothetical protein
VTSSAARGACGVARTARRRRARHQRVRRGGVRLRICGGTRDAHGRREPHGRGEHGGVLRDLARLCEALRGFARRCEALRGCALFACFCEVFIVLRRSMSCKMPCEMACVSDLGVGRAGGAHACALGRRRLRAALARAPRACARCGSGPTGGAPCRFASNDVRRVCRARASCGARRCARVSRRRKLCGRARRPSHYPPAGRGVGRGAPRPRATRSGDVASSIDFKGVRFSIPACVQKAGIISDNVLRLGYR